MANYREILRLHSLGNSQRSIARDVQSSRDTVADVIKAADAAGIAWPLDDDVTNEDIQEILMEYNRVRNLGWSTIEFAIWKRWYGKTIGAPVE